MRRVPVRALAAAAAFALSATLVRADDAETLSTAADRTSVNVTAYNAGIALVHDRRRVDVASGARRIAWRDVAALLQPETAVLSKPAKPRDLSIVEQNFDYDVLGAASILAKFVGRDVTVTHPRASPGRPQVERARVLANDGGGVVLQYADRTETAIDGTIAYPELPPDLRDRPTLVVDVETKDSGPRDLDLAYVTGGIDWHADYVGVVSTDGATLDLDGTVTLSNQSGATFENARLQLVAGNVDAPRPQAAQLEAMTIARVAIRHVREESYFEYHLYTLDRPTTIAQNQTKQVALLSARGVPIRETLELRGDGSAYRSENADLGRPERVRAYVTFANDGGDLGIPLPAGTVRLYRDDAGGTSQFLGSDTIAHTPAKQDVRLHLGDAFDVTARRRQTAFHVDGNRYDSSYEIVVGNAKAEPVDVLVVEPVPCEWTVTAESAPHVKSSSATATWTLHVPAGGETTLDYSTRLDCG